MAEFVNFKMILEYDGSRYDGWQKQGNTDKTIQGKIEQVLEKMCGQPVEIHGSGRTDAGVHAHGQVANFHLPSAWAKKANEVMDYLNHYLPEDIRILSCEKVHDRFHARLNATEKTYLYVIDRAEKKNVFTRKYVYGLGKTLDLGKMKEAAGMLSGTHDFKSYCSLKKMKKSAVRTITSIEFSEKGSLLEIRYTGDGFLYNMVRILTGTLIEVGLGERSIASIRESLDGCDRSLAGYTAPAEGLFLEGVRYS